MSILRFFAGWCPCHIRVLFYFIPIIQTYFIYRAVYFGMYDTIRHFVEEDKKNLHFVSSYFIAQVSIFFPSSWFITFVYAWGTYICRYRPQLQFTIRSLQLLGQKWQLSFQLERALCVMKSMTAVYNGHQKYSDQFLKTHFCQKFLWAHPTKLFSSVYPSGGLIQKG